MADMREGFGFQGNPYDALPSDGSAWLDTENLKQGFGFGTRNSTGNSTVGIEEALNGDLPNDYSANMNAILNAKMQKAKEQFGLSMNKALWNDGMAESEKTVYKIRNDKEDTMRIFRMSLSDLDVNVPVASRIVHTAEYHALDGNHVLLGADVTRAVEMHNEKRRGFMNEFNVPLRNITVDDLKISVSVVDDLS